MRIVTGQRRPFSRKTDNLIASLCYCCVVDCLKQGRKMTSFLQKLTAINTENRCVKDNHRRVLAEKHELRRRLYKSLVRDPSLPSEMRENAFYKLSKLPRNSSFTRVRNRCVFTGRARGVYQAFRMSRIVFRTLASNGMLNGIKKASW